MGKTYLVNAKKSAFIINNNNYKGVINMNIGTGLTALAGSLVAVSSANAGA